MKIIFLLLAFCISQTASAQENRKLVVTTASIFADMAAEIAGNQLDIQSIVPIGGDPHTYEPIPADARLISQADLILKNSLTFEGWLDDLIESAGNNNTTVVTITEGITPISSVYKGSSDPHAWMDASLGLVYIENIKNALIAIDPDNRKMYEFNYGVYRQQLEEMDQYIFEQIRKIPEKRRILVTSHDAFQYYGRRYGIRLESILGVSTEAEAQTSDIIRLTKVIEESGIPSVFIETTVNPKLLEQVAKDNKVTIGGSLYSDSIGEKDSPAPSYLMMLKYNTDTIVKALTSEPADNAPPEEKGTSWLLWILLAVVLAGGFFFVSKKLG